jgi:hypothetical protein
MNAKKHEEIQNMPKRPWEIALELGRTIPKESLDKLPKDLSLNLDHYLYGVPKEAE